MINISVIHGVVEGKNSNFVSHRNFFEKSEFENYVKTSSSKFISLSEALQRGEGNVITIDDSIYAAYNAALLLKEYGHQVSVFINPFYIENAQDYYISCLNYYLDVTTEERIIVNNEQFELTNFALKDSFRRKFRAYLRGFIFEEERDHEIFELGRLLKLENPLLPRYLKTVTKEDTEYLIRNGIELENHGWIHNTIHNPDDIDLEFEQFEMAKEWLFKNFGVDSRFYAPPFGDFVNKRIKNTSGLDLILLFSEKLKYGFVSRKVFNRTCNLGNLALISRK